MTFKNANLSVLNYALGFTMWHYSTTAKFSVVEKANYFKDLRHLGNHGDIIIITAADGTFVRQLWFGEKEIGLVRVG